MYIILSGRLHGITHVSGENVARVRNIFGGDCVNILCVLKIWNLCVETVIADSSGVETYAITSEDFASLFDFKDPMDLLTWEDMCTHEVCKKTRRTRRTLHIKSVGSCDRTKFKCALILFSVRCKFPGE